MSIVELQINRFRNIQEALIQPGSGFNFFYGPNGAGKTSILETIYHLGTGRSFRATQTQLLIEKESENFLIYAKVEDGQHQIPMGVERYRDGRKTIRMNGENVLSLASLAQQLPILFFGPESHRFFHEGPRLRRQVLDWGVFHVEHSFHLNWKLCENILKQRNALLKNKATYNDIVIWDIEFARAAQQLDNMRANYVSELQPIAQQVLANLLNISELNLFYERGWNITNDLGTILKKNFDRDVMLGYTQAGPHRADLQLLYEKSPAQNYLSQGQQKLAAYALHLAQGILLEQKTAKKPIYLIDDLSSELDTEKRRAVLDVLNSLQTQIFVTSTSYNDLDISNPKFQLFHVEQGRINSCSTVS